MIFLINQQCDSEAFSDDYYWAASSIISECFRPVVLGTYDTYLELILWGA